MFYQFPAAKSENKSFYNPIQLLAYHMSVSLHEGSLQVSTGQAMKRIEAVWIIRFVGAREVSSGKMESEVEN